MLRYNNSFISGDSIRPNYLAFRVFDLNEGHETKCSGITIFKDSKDFGFAPLFGSKYKGVHCIDGIIDYFDKNEINKIYTMDLGSSEYLGFKKKVFRDGKAVSEYSSLFHLEDFNKNGIEVVFLRLNENR